MSTGTQDWTAGESIGDPDDFSFGTTTAPDKTPDEIGAENSYREIPPGDHTLVVVGYEKPTTERYTVLVGAKLVNGQWTGGTLSGFTGNKLQVKLAKDGDPGATIRDFFTGPPSDPNEMNAYLNGIAKDAKPNARGGFHASKFYHFLGAMGYDWERGGQVPSAAMRPANWKGRKVNAKVVAGKGDYEDKKTGEMKPRGPQVGMFSYTRVAGGNNTGTPPGAPSAAQARPAASSIPANRQPVAAASSNPGINDI
jgi:hypothetical protein